MNSQEIHTVIRMMIDEPTAQSWTDEDLYRHMNTAHQGICDELIGAGEGYFRRAKLVSFVANTDTYALPENLAKIDRIERADGSEPTEVEPITLAQEEEFRNDNLLRTGTKREGYIIEGENIRYVPTPTSAITNALRIRYTKQQPQIHSGNPTASTATTVTFAVSPTRGVLTPIDDAYEGWIFHNVTTGERRKITAYVTSTRVATVAAWTVNPLVTDVYALVPEMAERWHHLIAEKAAILARISKYDEAQDLEAIYAPDYLNFKDAIKPRQQQRPRRVVYVEP